jgi:iduronate 2-sulfatase
VRSGKACFCAYCKGPAPYPLLSPPLPAAANSGYQLGELNEWSKKTNTELAVRVPLMIRVPWKAAAAGASSSVRAELVDVYRTLVDLAGSPAGSVQPDVQGTSLAPLFDQPSAPPPALAGKAAFSQIGSCACGNYSHRLPTGANWTGLECNSNRCGGTPVNRTDFDFMGYSMRTAEGWRYSLWAPMNHTTSRVHFDPALCAEELYDQRGDAGADFDLDAYYFNVATLFPAVAAELRKELIAAVQSWY